MHINMVYNNSNEIVLCHVLLDSEFQNNFITESMVKYLQLKKKKEYLLIINIINIIILLLLYRYIII